MLRFATSMNSDIDDGVVEQSPSRKIAGMTESAASSVAPTVLVRGEQLFQCGSESFKR